MPLHPGWDDIALRLLLTVVAGGVIGVNRASGGHAAGLRTTILVGLAAALSMVLANALLALHGKAADSFVQTDVMRLPLGILTGVGFIGGGAILRRGNLIVGITTAATIWIITVIGLCFGAGHVALGSAGTALAFAALGLLKWVDDRIPRRRHAMVEVDASAFGATLREFEATVAPLGYHAQLRGQTVSNEPPEMRVAFRVSWHASDRAGSPQGLMEALNERFTVRRFEIVEETEA
jgi:putative Mg2+ transporter-C (MgtC) family protein